MEGEKDHKAYLSPKYFDAHLTSLGWEQVGDGLSPSIDYYDKFIYAYFNLNHVRVLKKNEQGALFDLNFVRKFKTFFFVLCLVCDSRKDTCFYFFTVHSEIILKWSCFLKRNFWKLHI